MERQIRRPIRQIAYLNSKYCIEWTGGHQLCIIIINIIHYCPPANSSYNYMRICSLCNPSRISVATSMQYFLLPICNAIYVECSIQWWPLAWYLTTMPSSSGNGLSSDITWQERRVVTRHRQTDIILLGPPALGQKRHSGVQWDTITKLIRNWA